MVPSTAKTQRSRYNPVFSLGHRTKALIRYNELVFVGQEVVLRKRSHVPLPIEYLCQWTPQFQSKPVALSSQELWIPSSVGLTATMLQWPTISFASEVDHVVDVLVISRKFAESPVFEKIRTSACKRDGGVAPQLFRDP
jgi:hypothetical protein